MRDALRTPAWQVMAAIVEANLRMLARDRTSLIFLLVVPLLLILLIGLAAPGEQGAGRPIGVSMDEGDALSLSLLKRLDDDPALIVTRYPDSQALHRAVRRGREVAGVIIPAGQQDALEQGGEAEVQLLTDPSGPPAQDVHGSVSRVIASLAARLRSARYVAQERGITFPAAWAAMEDLPRFGGVEVVVETVGAEGGRAPTGFAYSAPAYLLLFMFINTLVAAHNIPRNRAEGLFRRSFAAPVSATSVLLGEGLYRFVVALFQALVIIGFGALLFGVHWGDPLAVFVLTLLFALVCAGGALLLGTLARTGAQVIALAAPLGIALGMLGGCMWPLEIVGPSMQLVGHLTPHAWAMNAFIGIVGAGADITEIALELTVLAGFALVVVVGALILFHRALAEPA